MGFIVFSLRKNDNTACQSGSVMASDMWASNRPRQEDIKSGKASLASPLRPLATPSTPTATHRSSVNPNQGMKRPRESIEPEPEARASPNKSPDAHVTSALQATSLPRAKKRRLEKCSRQGLLMRSRPNKRQLEAAEIERESLAHVLIGEAAVPSSGLDIVSRPASSSRSGVPRSVDAPSRNPPEHPPRGKGRSPRKTRSAMKIVRATEPPRTRATVLKERLSANVNVSRKN